MQDPAGDDGGLDDDGDDVDDLVDHALVPLERARAVPQLPQALQQALVALRAQVIICPEKKRGRLVPSDIYMHRLHSYTVDLLMDRSVD